MYTHEARKSSHSGAFFLEKRLIQEMRVLHRSRNQRDPTSVVSSPWGGLCTETGVRQTRQTRNMLVRKPLWISPSEPARRSFCARGCVWGVLCTEILE